MAPLLIFFLSGCYDNKQMLAMALLFPESPTRSMTTEFMAANNDALTGAFLGLIPSDLC
jgi:hypothetical protein